MSRFNGDGVAVLGGTPTELPTDPKQLPDVLKEGAVLSVFHEAITGMFYVVVKESRFDIAPRTVPIPAHMMTAIYARVLNDQCNRMAGMMALPGLVPVCEMAIGPTPTPS